MSGSSRGTAWNTITKFRNVIIGATIVVAGIVGIGGYALGATGSQVIKACYESKAPHTMIKDSTCPKGYTALQWTSSGPQGPAGAKGAVGPAGPAGLATAGTGGLNVTQVNGPAVSGAGSSTPVTSTAWCPVSNPYIVGGGYTTSSGAAVVSAPDDTPTSGPSGGSGSPIVGGWQAEVVLSSGQAQAYALCSQ